MNIDESKKRHCMNCQYCEPVQVDGAAITIGQKIGQCTRMPPTAVFIPTQGGIQQGSMFPIVTDKLQCAEFAIKRVPISLV